MRDLRGLTSLSPIAGDPALLRDTFTDTDKALTAHTMDRGGGWSVLAGTWEIASNQAKAVPTIPDSVATADAGAANGTITADVTVPNTTNYSTGIVARASDVSNFILIIITRSGGTAALMMLTKIANSYTVRGQNNFSVPPTGTTVPLTVTLNGDTITASAPNVSPVSYSTTFNNTVTKHGFYDSTTYAGNAPGYFDNFLVTP